MKTHLWWQVANWLRQACGVFWQTSVAASWRRFWGWVRTPGSEEEVYDRLQW